MVVTTINKKLTPHNYNKGGNRKTFVVIHDVGVKGQTAKNNVDYFARVKVSASAHYFVDRTSIWQSVDDNDTAWHVGDGKGKFGIYNRDCLGIEMIVEKDGTIHPETKENTKWLVKHLQSKYKIPNDKIIRHFDASHKNCPQYLNRDKKWTEWYEFYNYLIDKEEDLTVEQYNELKKLINDQAKTIKELEAKINEESKLDKPKSSINPSSWAKEAWEWAKKKKDRKGNPLVDGSNPSDYISREQVITILKRYDDIDK